MLVANQPCRPRNQASLHRRCAYTDLSLPFRGIVPRNGVKPVISSPPGVLAGKSWRAPPALRPASAAGTFCRHFSGLSIRGYKGTGTGNCMQNQLSSTGNGWTWREYTMFTSRLISRRIIVEFCTDMQWTTEVCPSTCTFASKRPALQTGRHKHHNDNQ